MTADDIDLHTLPLYHCAQLDCFPGEVVHSSPHATLGYHNDPAKTAAAFCQAVKL